MTRKYKLGRREESAAATRRRILDVATELMTASGFHPIAIDEIAAQAATTRPTIYRHFGSKVGLFEAVAWNVLSAAGIERLDKARQLDDPVAALHEFLRANCRMFAEMGTGLSAALDAARTEPEIAKILDITYYGRRIESLQHLAGRLVDAGHVSAGWSSEKVVDALVVLTNVETFGSLHRHRSRSWQEIADALIELSNAFVDPRRSSRSPNASRPSR